MRTPNFHFSSYLNERGADDEIENIKNISVSVDGSWQRHGYFSHNGVVTAILIDTGKFGRKASIVIFENLKMIPGKYTVEDFSKVNDKRVDGRYIEMTEILRKDERCFTAESIRKMMPMRRKRANCMNQEDFSIC